MAGHGMAWDGIGIARPADKVPCHVVQGHALPWNTYGHSGMFSSLLGSPSVINYAHALLLVLHLG